MQQNGVVRGVLVAESLREGAALAGVPLTVRKVWRVAPQTTIPEQPPVWTLLEFEAPEAEARRLAAELAEVLATPGWYADFHSAGEKFVVFPGRVFRAARGDRTARTEIETHARSLDVPEDQLDWSD